MLSPNPAGGEAVLIDGSDSVPTNYEVNTALIYGDYFFTEALLRLQNEIEHKPGWTLYSWNAAVPEPSTWAMMALGFVGLGFAGCRKAQRGGSSRSGA